MPSEIDRAENVKHLELILAAVARLASNSFFVKGWALTVAGAAFGFAVNRIDWRIATVGSFVIIGFWLLDAYYLRQERLLRHLYNHVRRNVTSDPEERFSMNLLPFAGFDTVQRRRVFFSTTLFTFYALLVFAGVGIAVFSLVTGPVVPQAPR